MTDTFEELRELRLERPGGRTVAWTECGDPDGRPLIRLPGTPGCRHNVRVDRTPWAERALRVLTTERPGFGASDPLPGHGFAEPADDIAAILDHAGIESAHVWGVSGAAPYELALAARHPKRVRAVTVVVGAAPATAAEQAQLVDVNATSYRLIMAGDYDGLRAMSAALREEILEDPMAAFAGMMEHAAEADRQVMQDPAWQAALAAGWREALRQGADGWVDEDIALETRWDDLDFADIRTSITWWHGASDAAAPLAAAERVVAALPDARLVRFGDHEGHLAGYHREAEILDELLARGVHSA